MHTLTGYATEPATLVTVIGKKMTFEEKLKKLTQIVEQLEEGNRLPLSDSLKLFEEGIGLIASCRQILENAEQRVEIVLETDNA